ncbi:MAG TPA: hypothetical protein GX497_12865 [Bacillus bacterium]|nr:hypothetical protein [Bacillus sp. (in: firmicutes)]
MGIWSKVTSFFKSKKSVNKQSPNNDLLPTAGTFQQQVEHDDQKAVDNQNTNNNLLPTGRTFQQQIEHDYQNAVEYYKNSPNPKFHRSSKEENLAFNFSSRYSGIIGTLEANVYHESNKVFGIWTIDDRIEQCKKAIAAYEKLQKFCLSKGKGGQIHFEDMWEHCHNSNNPNFRYIEQVEEELDYLTNNYHEATEKLQIEKLKYEKKERIKIFKKTADKVLIDLITENNGILQKDLYKQFDNEYKTTINSTLKKLHESGIIIRVKEGNTYKLLLNR